VVVVTLTVDETNGAVGVSGGGGGTPVPVPHHNPLHNRTPSADGGSGGVGGTPRSGTPPLAPRSGTPPLGHARTPSGSGGVFGAIARSASLSSSMASFLGGGA